jgi:hypothetical protein
VETPEKHIQPIGKRFVRLLRLDQAGNQKDISWSKSQKAGLQMLSAALIAEVATLMI